jgi:hypothetical protein
VAHSLEPEEELWLLKAAQENYDKINDSRVFLTIFHHDMVKDTIPCIQLGLAIMLDKPIIVVCPEDVRIPENLKKVAIGIYQGGIDTPAFMEFMKEHLGTG